MARTVLEIFLSSTAADLKQHRDAVYARLARIEFFKCIRQEDFGAQDAEALQYCCDKARVADLFVGMIGLRRGWEPHGDNAKRSITEMEFDSAKSAGRARYLWVSPDDFAVPGNLRESDAEHRRQLAFRKRVMGGGERIVSQKGFASPEALASEIVEQLLAHVVTGDLIKLLRPELGQAGMTPADDQKPAIAAAVEKLAEDKDVDLLALAKNPQGVDIAALEAKLKARAEAHEATGQKESKTSAEYWRHIGALAFLHNTQSALSAYQKAVALDPCEPDGLRYLGELQFRIDDLKAAEESFAALTTVGRQANDKRAESMGLTRTAWIYRRRGDLTQAKRITTNALRLAESAGWADGTARAYSNLGLIEDILGDFSKAEEMQLKSLALFEELDEKTGVAIAYANLGHIHLSLGDFSKAEDMQLKSLKLSQEQGRKQGIAVAYSNLGAVEQARGNLDKAEEMHRNVLTLSEELGSKEGIAVAYSNLGAVEQARGNLDKSEEMLRKSLKLNKELRSKDGVATNYGRLGTIHQTRGHLDEAEKMQLKALALYEALGSKRGIASACWNLGVIYNLTGNKAQLCKCWLRAHNLYSEMGLAANAANAESWLKRHGCDTASPIS